MSSVIRKRSITIGGLATSIAVEDPFWHELRRMAEARNQTVAKLVVEIKGMSAAIELSSAVRIFVLQHARQRPALIADDVFFLPP